MITKVLLSRLASRQIKKVPRHILHNFMAWVDDVERRGVEEVRKILGYHDEPLKSTHSRERSIRLSRAYRALYEMQGDYLTVLEVTKHEY